LAKKDKKLYDWVEEAKNKNVPVIYMSIGTVNQYEDWTLKALAEGANKIGCRVVWSLPDAK